MIGYWYARCEKARILRYINALWKIGSTLIDRLV